MASFDGRARRRALGRRPVGVFLLVLCASIVPACGGVFGKVYEYEEDVHVALDGSAEVTVNASIAALVALRGFDLNIDPAARVDRDRLRALYSSPYAEVRRVS